MKLIELKIRYDPEYPFDWVSEAEYYEKQYPSHKKPLFPYSWRKDGVVIGPWVVMRKTVHTRGFDPYSGEEWELRTKKFGFRISTVICMVVQIRLGDRVAEWRYSWAKDMPWLLRKVLEAFEYRYDWYMHNEYVEDPYGSLGYYE